MTMFDIISNYRGFSAIYSREISRKRSRVTFFFHMSVNQRLQIWLVFCFTAIYPKSGRE